MKPKNIKSMADLKATFNWHRKEAGFTARWETFVECQEMIPAVSVTAQMALFRVKSFKTMANWIEKYKYFRLRGDTVEA